MKSSGRKVNVELLALSLAGALWQAGVWWLWLDEGAQFSKYGSIARALLDGSIPAARALDLSPLYLELHMIFCRLGLDSVAWTRALQFCAVGLAGALIFDLLRPRAGRLVAVIGLLALQLNPGVLIYSSVLEPEAMLLLLLTATLWGAARRGLWPRLIAGLALGAMLWMRLNGLVLLPLLALLVHWHHDEGRGPSRELLAATLPVLLALLLLMSRNLALSDGAASLGMNPGTVFFEGNHPLSYGQSAAYPPLVGNLAFDLSEQPDPHHLAYRRVARRERQQELSVAQVNAIWSQRAWRFLSRAPRAAAHLWLRKAHMALRSAMLHDIIFIAQRDARLRHGWLPRWPQAFLVALALLGGWSQRRRWRQDVVLYGALFGQLAMLVLLYVSERQRLALLPSLAVLAALGVAELWRRRVSLASIVVVLLAVLLHLDDDAVLDARWFWAHDNNAMGQLARAKMFQERGEIAAAQEELARALAEQPWQGRALQQVGLAWSPAVVQRAIKLTAQRPIDHASAQLDRALLLLLAGQREPARLRLRDLIERRVRPLPSRSYSTAPEFYLAWLQHATQPQQALLTLRQGLGRRPHDPWLLALQASYLPKGAAADRAVGDIADIYGPLEAGALVLQVCLNRSQRDNCDHWLPAMTLVRALPRWRKGRVLAARVLARQGRVRAAVVQLMQALQRRPLPLPPEREARGLLQRWVQARPNDAQRVRVLAEVDLLYGDAGAARHHLHLAAELGLDAADMSAVQKKIDQARRHGALDAPYQGTSK